MGRTKKESSTPRDALEQVVIQKPDVQTEWHDLEKEHLETAKYLFDKRAYEEIFASEVILDNKRVLMFGSVNYLGLSHNPKIKKVAIEAIERYGVGGTGSRASNGCSKLHLQLDESLAEFMGKKKAIVFNSGYMANLGIITAAFSKDAVILSDKENHLSIYDGCKLSGLLCYRYRHNDLDHLETFLKRIPINREKWIVLVGTFGVTGESIPLIEIIGLAKKYNCKIYLDDAHLIGIYGEKKQGLADKLGVLDELDLIMGSFQMAFGNIGAFVAGNQQILEKVQAYSRPYIFTYTLPLYVVATLLESINILTSVEGDKLVYQLLTNVDKLRCKIKSLRFKIASEDTQLISIEIGDEKSAKEFYISLMNNGLWGQLYIYPAVPINAGIFRLTCTAAHTDEQIKEAANILEKQGKTARLI
jgi:7-keto-8-aminopelargonate synthetase-like enzyme